MSLTLEKQEFIKENYYSMTLEELGEAVGMEGSSIRRIAHKIGMKPKHCKKGIFIAQESFSKLKEQFKIGQRIKVNSSYARGIHKNIIRGTVFYVGKYYLSIYIKGCAGKYKESVNYVDILTGDIQVGIERR